MMMQRAEGISLYVCMGVFYFETSEMKLVVLSSRWCKEAVGPS